MKKKQGIGKVFNNSIIYAICGLLTNCLSFFMLPLYTAYLTTNDYGITSITSSFLSTAAYIASFSLFAAIDRFFVDLKGDREKLKRFYGTVINFVMLSATAFVLLMYAFRSILIKTIFIDIDFFPIVLITLGSLIFYCQRILYMHILKSQQKAFKYGVVTVTFFVFGVLMNVLFVAIFRMGATGVLIAGLVSYAVYFIYVIIDLKVCNMITFCMDMDLLKRSLKYSIPIIPHNISTIFAALVSKVLINGSASLGLLGIYSIAAQFGNIADIVQTYSSSAYTPWLFENIKEGKEGYKENIRRTANVLAAVVGLLLIGISFFAKDYIILFLDESYTTAWKFVPFIVWVYVIKIMYYFYVGVLLYYKKASRFLFTATVSSSILNVLLSFVFIPIWGAYGSIVADTISMILRVFIIVYISKKFDDVGLRIRDFIFRIAVIFIFTAVGLIFSYTMFENRFSIIDFLYRCFVTFVYVITIILPYKREIINILKFKSNKK